MNNMNVLLVDDHALFRAGIRTLLQTVPGVHVIGEASNGRDALQQISEQPPDIVLIDIAMAELNGIDTIRLMLDSFPDIRPVVLTMHATRQYVLRAMDAGAAGYLTKDAAPTELEDALRSVSSGQKYLSPRVANYVIDELRQYLKGPALTAEAQKNPIEEITTRQREILQLIAEGYSSKEMAEKLNVSIKTIDVHRTQLMRRLDIHDIAGLVRYAIRYGIIDVQA